MEVACLRLLTKLDLIIKLGGGQRSLESCFGGAYFGGWPFASIASFCIQDTYIYHYLT